MIGKQAVSALPLRDERCPPRSPLPGVWLAFYVALATVYVGEPSWWPCLTLLGAGVACVLAGIPRAGFAQVAREGPAPAIMAGSGARSGHGSVARAVAVAQLHRHRESSEYGAWHQGPPPRSKRRTSNRSASARPAKRWRRQPERFPVVRPIPWSAATEDPTSGPFSGSGSPRKSLHPGLSARALGRRHRQPQPEGASAREEDGTRTRRIRARGDW